MSNSFKPTTALFFVGSLGGLFCVLEWFHTLDKSWLFGVAVAASFLTWSITDAILATRRDVQAWRKAAALQELPEEPLIVRKRVPIASKPLRQNGYFRAGVMGLPFCILEWFWKDKLVFLLGAGFFAGMLFPSIYARWKWNRQHHFQQIDREVP